MVRSELANDFRFTRDCVPAQRLSRQMPDVLARRALAWADATRLVKALPTRALCEIARPISQKRALRRCFVTNQGFSSLIMHVLLTGTLFANRFVVEFVPRGHAAMSAS